MPNTAKMMRKYRQRRGLYRQVHCHTAQVSEMMVEKDYFFINLYYIVSFLKKIMHSIPLKVMYDCLLTMHNTVKEILQLILGYYEAQLSF